MRGRGAGPSRLRRGRRERTASDTDYGLARLRATELDISRLSCRECGPSLLAGLLGSRRRAAGVRSGRDGARESQQVYLLVLPASGGLGRLDHVGWLEEQMTEVAKKGATPTEVAEKKATPKTVVQAMSKSLPACAPEARTRPHEVESECEGRGGWHQARMRMRMRAAGATFHRAIRCEALRL